jgi:hypothetical protein
MAVSLLWEHALAKVDYRDKKRGRNQSKKRVVNGRSPFAATCTANNLPPGAILRMIFPAIPARLIQSGGLNNLPKT